MNLMDEMEQEHNHSIMAKTERPSSHVVVADKKENRHPNNNNNNNNFAAMRQIMRRKELANMARKELDASSAAKKSKEVADCNEGSTMDKGATNDDDNIESLVVEDGESSLSLDERDASSGASSQWAMLGNHMNETTMDREENSAELESELALISPARWKQQEQQQQHDLRSESLSVGDDSNLGNTIGDGSNGGISGVLSFLGESPLFDETIAEDDDGDEATRNLDRSAEKVRRLEEHLLRSVAKAGGGGVPSPVQPPRGVGNDDGCCDDDSHVVPAHGAGGGNDREKEVTFAIEEGWETPRPKNGYSKYRNSPYVADSKGGMTMMMTPSSKMGESMEVQANPMNESVIVSDDEASGDAVGSPSPLKGIGSDDGSDRSENDFHTTEGSDDEGILGLGSKANSPGGKRHRIGKKKRRDITPTRASLMERNQTLVKEVRFADQTCVELSE